MLKWIKKMRIKRYARLLGEYLLQNKDAQVKEIRLVKDSDADYNNDFKGLSYIHIHCEKDRKQSNYYISTNKEEELTLWRLMMIIGASMGFSIK